MRVMSYNVNGIRAAVRKGFAEWLPEQSVDVLCIQETKAQLHQLEGLPEFFPEGYHCYYEDATAKKGYSGVAIYAKKAPDEIIRGIPEVEEFNGEGRYIEARFGNLSVISLYLPSGSSGEHRQQSKDRFLAWFMPELKKKAASGRDYIVCGDWNIAHKEIDLKNWKGNKKNSGFLPHERAWMDELLADPADGGAGMVDAFREVDPREGRYTWWSNRGQAYANDVGWRIDYHIVTQSLKDKIQASEIHRDSKFSDHAALVLDYDYAF